MIAPMFHLLADAAVPQAQSNWTSIALAIIGVVGGSAAWTFWAQVAKNRHELRMSELADQREENKQRWEALDTAAATVTQLTSDLHAQAEHNTARIEAVSKRVEVLEATPIPKCTCSELAARVDRLELATSVKPSSRPPAAPKLDIEARVTALEEASTKRKRGKKATSDS